MIELHLKINDVAGSKAKAWTAELWSGFPYSAEKVRLAGGAKTHTKAQLEERKEYKGETYELDEKYILAKVRGDEDRSPLFTAVGLRLYEFLEATGVGQEWTQQRQGDGSRTYLEIPDSISAWPWELLARMPGRLPQYAFNDETNTVVRFTGPGNPGLKWEDSTARVLLVSGQEKLDGTATATTELRAIRKAFHTADLSVIIETCEAPSDLDALRNKINDFCPHILHFIGHGELVGAQFALLFHSPSTPIWHWGSDSIQQFFRPKRQWRPRLAVLNACHGSQFDANAASVADALLEAGVPAVIGAQAPVRIDNALAFAEKFYGALIANALAKSEYTLDQAVTSARARLGEDKGLDSRSWALPILRVNAPIGEVLRLKPAHPQVVNCTVVKEVFVRRGRFVNRNSDRWDLLSKFVPALPHIQACRGVILNGAPSLGKSWLVKRAIRDFLDSGFLVRYATLSGKGAARTSLDVLEDWRGRPEQKGYLLKPLDGEHFTEFDRCLTEARQRKAAKADADVFAAFKRGFQAARGEKKLLLVLDRLRQKDCCLVSSRDFQEGLLEQLLLPIQANPVNLETDGFCALLIARNHPELTPAQAADVDEFGLTELTEFAQLPVPTFQLEQLDKVIDEFVEFADDKELRAIIKSRVQEPRWSPQKLQLFEQLVKPA